MAYSTFVYVLGFPVLEQSDEKHTCWNVNCVITGKVVASGELAPGSMDSKKD